MSIIIFNILCRNQCMSKTREKTYIQIIWGTKGTIGLSRKMIKIHNIKDCLQLPMGSEIQMPAVKTRHYIWCFGEFWLWCSFICLLLWMRVSLIPDSDDSVLQFFLAPDHLRLVNTTTRSYIYCLPPTTFAERLRAWHSLSAPLDHFYRRTAGLQSQVLNRLETWQFRF